jgi:site-specific DNA-cytosine methylase
VHSGDSTTPTDRAALNEPHNQHTARGYRKLEPHEHMRSVEHEPAYTVMASAPHHWTDESGTKLRAVAVEEAAALQGFPESFNMDGVTVAARRRGIGNAVPVEAARRLFEACVENM